MTQKANKAKVCHAFMYVNSSVFGQFNTFLKDGWNININQDKGVLDQSQSPYNLVEQQRMVSQGVY